MKTQRIISILLISLYSFSLFAIESEIEQVIVYRRGAKISRNTQFTVSPGNQEIVISNLTSTIDPNSLQVNLRGNAILLSAKYQNCPYA